MGKPDRRKTKQSAKECTDKKDAAEIVNSDGHSSDSESGGERTLDIDKMVSLKVEQILEINILKCFDKPSILNKLGEVFESCLVQKLGALETQIEALEKENTELKQRMLTVENNNEKRTTETNTLKATILGLQNEINKTNDRLEANERYSRRDNLVICGLNPTTFSEAASQESSKATTEAVISFCNLTLSVPVQPADIVTAHRLPAAAGRSQDSAAATYHASSIVVRFANRRVRDSVFFARKKLKEMRSNLFINEHLTSDAAQLFKTTRRLQKEKKIHSCWTFNGVVFFRSAPDSTPHQVKRVTDLPAR